MSVSNSDNLLTEQDQSLIRAGIDFLKEYFADQGEGAKEVGKTKKEQVNQTKRTNPDNAATRSAQDSPRLSKTAIGRRIFELQDLPQLCVITVEVHQVAGKDGTGEVEPGWNRVYNTSLKEKAIGELLRNDFPRIYHTAIVSTRTSDHVDQIIIFDGTQLSSSTKNLSAKFEPKIYDCPELNASLKVSIEARAASGCEQGEQFLAVRCKTTGQYIFVGDDHDNKSYQAALLALIRGRASATSDDSPRGAVQATPSAHKGPTFVRPLKFFYNVSNNNGSPTTFNPRLPGCEAEGGTQDGNMLEFMFRIRMQIAFSHAEKALQLDYDMVSGVPHTQGSNGESKSLTVLDIVRSIVGDELDKNEGDVKNHLNLLKQVLLGLKVRRIYPPPPSWDYYRKQNFQAPFAIDDVSMEDGIKGKSPYQVLKEKYNIESKHQYLPLVGRFESRSFKAWFPLEHLAIEPGQHITNCAVLRPILKQQITNRRGAIMQLLNDKSKAIWSEINRPRTQETSPALLWKQDDPDAVNIDPLTFAMK